MTGIRPHDNICGVRLERKVQDMDELEPSPVPHHSSDPASASAAAFWPITCPASMSNR